MYMSGYIERERERERERVREREKEREGERERSEVSGKREKNLRIQLAGI